MADWLTHTLIGWITGKTMKQDITLVVIGALIPDLTKLTLLFTWLGVYDHQFFDPLHFPIGAFLVAGIIALFFQDIRKAFLALGIGVTTHFILDFFLVHTHGGITLLFPLSWEGWQIYWYRSDDYWVTIVVLIATFLVYGIFWYHERGKTNES